ncbi:MAG: pilus assembly protein N-terminal domain-containing protein [Planctomycetaceae bacterium]|nr:pilus assembly protein N-terminal domain-containing protein [Planctomycetaceae bacterium]
MPGLVCRCRIGMLGLTALVIAAAPVLAQPGANRPLPNQTAANADPVFVVTSPKNNEITITEHFSKVVELKSRIVRVDGFDPEVIGVSALTPNQIRVQALKPGVTTIVLVDEFGATITVDVFVVGDVRHLQAYLSQLFPRSSVEAIAVKDAVVLRGWVDQPEHITQMVDVAERFFPTVLNQMRVGGVQQVSLKVQVMEVQRAKIRRLGLNFLYNNKNAFLTNTVGNLTPLESVALAVPTAGAVTPPVTGLVQNSLRGTQGAFGIVGPSNAFQAYIDALKTETLLKILAEPELVTTNGRPANMLAGGEFPILVPQSLGTTSIQWREFGVRMEAVPIILGAGRVRLDLQPEVSERDFSNAVAVNGITVPGLTTRRVNTQVEMKFGETFMLAGLLSMRNTAQTDKIPFLGELPYVGAAFRRVRYEEAETELIIMVTPELVSPTDPALLPPGGPGQFTDVPTDKELYGSGFLEVPKYSDANLNTTPTDYGVPGGRPGPGGPGLIGPGPGGPIPGGPLPRGVLPPNGEPIEGQLPPGAVPGSPFPNGRPGLIPPSETPSAPDSAIQAPPPPSAGKSGNIERTGAFQWARPKGDNRPKERATGTSGAAGSNSKFPNVVRSPGAKAAAGQKPGLIEPQ